MSLEGALPLDMWDHIVFLSDCQIDIGGVDGLDGELMISNSVLTTLIVKAIQAKYSTKQHLIPSP